MLNVKNYKNIIKCYIKTTFYPILYNEEKTAEILNI